MLVAAEHEHDPGARADAAHADDLVRRMGVPISLEQPPAVGAQRTPVGSDHSPHELLELNRLDAGHHFLDRDDERRVAGDPGLAVDDRRELREGLQAVLRPRLGQVALELLLLLCGSLLSRQRGDLVNVDAGVPELEVGHRGEAPDRLPVRARHRPVDRLPLFGVEAAIAAGDGEAGRQALDVPLERARQRLVEVVDAEHEPPVGRGEPTEVRQMRIAAELHVESGPRRAGQIGRHRVGRAAEERERRHEHPPVADRHQLRHAGSRLLLEQLDRIRPISRRRPLAVRGPWRDRPRRLSHRRALRGSRVRDRLRPGPPSRGLPYRGLNSRHVGRSLRRRRGSRIAATPAVVRSGSDHTAPGALRHRPNGMKSRRSCHRGDDEAASVVSSSRFRARGSRGRRPKSR